MDFSLCLVIESSSLTRSEELMKTLSKMLSAPLSQDKWAIILFDSSQKPTGYPVVSAAGNTNYKLSLQMALQLARRDD